MGILSGLARSTEHPSRIATGFLESYRVLLGSVRFLPGSSACNCGNPYKATYGDYK